MKIQYNLNDGEVIQMGDLPELSGDGVVDVSFAIPSEPLTYFTFDGTGLVRKSQQVIDKLESEASFNVVTMRKRLFEILSTLSNFALRLEIGAYEAFAESKNFVGMKQYTGMLVTAGIATTGDKDKIYAVMAEQGINLDNY